MHKVTIDRASWSNGDSFEKVREMGNGLRTQEDTQCCLGFVCEQIMEVPIPIPNTINQIISYPSELEKHPQLSKSVEKLPKILFDKLSMEDIQWLERSFMQAFLEAGAEFSDTLRDNLQYRKRWESLIAYVNDVRPQGDSLPEGLREKLLSAIFERLGIQVEYVGEKPIER